MKTRYEVTQPLLHSVEYAGIFFLSSSKSIDSTKPKTTSTSSDMV